LKNAQERQKGVQDEEDNFEERLQVMKEIIQDLQYRMTSNDDMDDRIVSDSMPPTTF